jgi:hypothetical protein
MNKKIYEEFTSANIIGVTLEHNGVKGGDAGHGGFVRLVIEDLGSTSMEVNGEESKKLELVFRGDTERDTLLSALKMVVKELDNDYDSKISKLSLKYWKQQLIRQEMEKIEKLIKLLESKEFLTEYRVGQKWFDDTIDIMTKECKYQLKECSKNLLNEYQSNEIHTTTNPLRSV